MKGELNPDKYKSTKSEGSKRKRVTTAEKDPVFKDSVKQQPNVKGKS